MFTVLNYLNLQKMTNNPQAPIPLNHYVLHSCLLCLPIQAKKTVSHQVSLKVLSFYTLGQSVMDCMHIIKYKDYKELVCKDSKG